jgi:hypothetical protein
MLFVCKLGKKAMKGFLVFTSDSWLLLFNRNNQKSCFKFLKKKFKN